VLIDYKKQDFEGLLKDYDLVLNSQDTATLKKSLNVLKPGGKLISISGPPTPAFANSIGAPWYIKMMLSLISSGVRKKAKQLGVAYSFLFMRADGKQLKEIANLIESGVINPVVDKVFEFGKINDALDYVESGRAKGKVVLRVITDR
jgi:alcohol dehydrogenase